MSEPSIRISETDFGQLQEAVLELSEASARLASVLHRLSSSCRWDVVSYPIPQSWLKENENLKLFLKFKGVGTGIPETPKFLLNFVDHFTEDFEKEAYVKPIFLAGFWAKIAVECHVSHETDYYPKAAEHWLVLRGGAWSEPALFLSEEDVYQFVTNSTFENQIVQPLGDWKEVFIYCSGAGIDPPTQWRWRKQT